jgi:hypothetical protein
MRRSLLPVLALSVAACGGGPSLFEGEMAAATIVVAMTAADAELVARDRYAVGSGDEDRLDVIRVGGAASVRPIYDSVPVPDPFEFVRDPLTAGPAAPVLDSATQIIVVLYPLVDRTPGGRVLSGSLIALGPDGSLLGADWDDDADRRVEALLAWAASRGIEPARAVELAIRGLGGDESADAQQAAGFVR